jgi:glycosyltransferase involved in cell wall biosynthesis
MRIAIAAPSSVPFRLGGAERAWNGLLRELILSTPHQADLIKLPAPEHSLLDVVRSYEAFSRLDLSGFDLLITTKYPAWITHHPRHVVYVFHPLRVLYDLYPKGLPRRADAADERVRSLQLLIRRRPERELLEDVFGAFHEIVAEIGRDDPLFAFPGPLARELVHFLDRVALDPREVVRHLALSRTVAGRRDYFPPGVAAEVLYLPPNLEGFSCRAFDYLFTPSRLEANKRVDLLVEAMRHVNSDVPLRIGGAGPERERLGGLAVGAGRIAFLGSLSDTELLDAYADALAVPVVPRNEELGLVTLEAMRSGKAVITCRDSGGPTELVEHGRTGLVTDPTPEAIASAIDQLASDPVLARRLGEEGRRRAESVTWHRTVTRLVESGMDSGGARRRAGRTKVVIASPARAFPPRAGFERRTAALAAALVEEFDVELVSLGVDGDRMSRETVAEGVLEAVVPRSAWHASVAAHAEDELRLPLGGLSAAMTAEHSPHYVFELARACRSAAILILARPYLQEAAAALPRPMPVVYHAHRAEAHAWAPILPKTPLGEQLLERVRSVERQAVLDARAVLVSGREDLPLLADYGIDADRLVNAPLGFHPVAVRSGEHSAQARVRWLARFSGSGEADRLAVFLGSGDALDVEAARWIAARAPELPRVVHVVVGFGHDDVHEVPANVVAIGALASQMRESLLAAADVSIIPLAHPATRLETAECLGTGAPCVLTPAAAHGLPVEDGVHALVGELEDVPEAVSRLLDDRRLAEQLGRGGRELVESEFDSEDAAERARSSVRAAIEARLAPVLSASR